MRTSLSCHLEVVDGILEHLVDFIRLAETIPGSEVLSIDIDSCAIALDGFRSVLHFQVLMAHECPG